MLLRHSLELETEALAVEAAVYRALEDGVRTADLATPGMDGIGSMAAGQAVLDRIVAS
jgi:3-isopropylmalate dehydrogenase